MTLEERVRALVDAHRHEPAQLVDRQLDQAIDQIVSERGGPPDRGGTMRRLAGLLAALRLLGLDPGALQSVQIEHTQPLPLG
jgi:hypothetical protein